MKFSKILFWFGIIIIVVQLCINIVNVIPYSLSDFRIPMQVWLSNVRLWAVVIVSPLWHGGLLIGVAKILDWLDSKDHSLVDTEYRGSL